MRHLPWSSSINQPAPFVPRTTPIIPANPHAIAIYDNYPVSPGHCLIIPKWHIASFFDATREEQASLLDLLAEMRQLQLNPPSPPLTKWGVYPCPTVSTSASTTAGQTITHLHIYDVL
jgi:diadenosine tetraphosphate (Ap4A) HIT family hydrolase